MSEREEVAPAESDLVEVLRYLGVAETEIEDAAAEGLLPLLAIETQVLGETPYDVDEVARRAGLGVERIRVLWGALGLAMPRSGEHIFNDTDVEQLSAVAALVDSGVADPELVIQLTRVIGSSLARIASTQAEILVNLGQTGTEMALTDASQWFGDTFTDVIGQVWRRHLQAEARSRLTKPGADGLDEDEPARTVGFADLVGFTALAQQLDSRSLAAVVGRFETVAFQTIGAHGGRVVKMIGDEVMFSIDDPVAAAHCALDLAESYHAADDLSDVRVGMAYGTVVDRDGDLFGPSVNLASRITAIAYPGSVVIDDALRNQLPDGEFTFRMMVPRRLKHVGLVRLHVLRPPDDGGEARSVRRQRRRARITELIGDIVPGRSDDGQTGGGTDPERRGSDAVR